MVEAFRSLSPKYFKSYFVRPSLKPISNSAWHAHVDECGGWRKNDKIRHLGWPVQLIEGPYKWPA